MHEGSNLSIFIEGNFESFFVEMGNTNKKTLIGVIYIPPVINTLDIFFENIQRILHNISSENKKSCIVGDANINLSSNTDSSIIFLNIMFSFCFMQCIHTVTKLNTDGNLTSFIDNIFSNTYMQLQYCTISYDISDHLPIFCTTYKKITNDNASHYKYIRNYTEEKMVSLSKLISKEGLLSVNG